MNCQEVQLQLSGYLEKSLDAIRMKGIETHLASCPFCRAEARGLSECVALVGALPALEPPAGFAQRVMAHVREFERELPPWRRLVAVLRTTIPIQATAVLLVGVLAVLVYQREPELRDGSIAELSPPPLALRADPDDTASVPALKSASETKVDPRSDRSERRRVTPEPVNGSTARAQPEPEVAPPPPESPVSPVRETSARSAFRVPFKAPNRAPIHAQEISTGHEPVRPGSDVFGFGASIGGLNRQPYGVTSFGAGRALSPLSEPTADFEFIVRRRGLERREATESAGDAPRKRSETEAAIASAAAQRAVPVPSAPASSIVEIRWFTVAPHHLDEFRRELAAEANIDAEKRAAIADTDSAAKPARDLLIKVVILPSDR